MKDKSRREFLGSLATILAATTTGKIDALASADPPAVKPSQPLTGLAAQAPVAQRPTPYVAIQMSPHTLLYEGFGPCLDLIQKTAAVNAVYPYSHAFHTTSLGQPPEHLAPDHGKPPRDFRKKVPMVWVRHHDEYFKNTKLRIKPTDPALEFADRDLFTELIQPARQRNMKVNARILEGSGLAIENFDLVRTIDAYGQKGAKACWSHPDYREFWKAVVADMFHHYDLDGFQWGAERMGPLMNVILPWNNDAPTCFCQHCIARGKAAGIDPDRAKEGYRKLYEYVRQLKTDAPKPAEGVYTIFLRHLIRYPEILSWQYQYRLSREEVQKGMYTTIKAIKPTAFVGWHVDQQPTSWDIVYRAEMSYEEMAPYSDYIKLILYHEVLGPRIRAWYLDRFKSTILSELSLEESLNLYYDVFGYDKTKEPKLNELNTKGFSPDFVYRETRRSVASANGKTQIIAGIGFDVPGSPPDDPERIYQATMKAFEGGAQGIMVSREYEEMRVPNLEAVGRAVRDWQKGMTLLLMLIGLLSMIQVSAQKRDTAIIPTTSTPAARRDTSQSLPVAGASIEQTYFGTRPAPELLASFDGIGEGFTGPQGTASLRNPSDNALAVGPDHIVQIVNTRMAIFTKKGRRFDTTGKVLYGPVETRNVFKGFGGPCEKLNNGDAVVRYDQLANRWLIVMPTFRRQISRFEDSATGAHIDRPQPGKAATLYQPPPGSSDGRPATPQPRPKDEKGTYCMCYAISTGPDPFGPYYRYEFDRPLFPDYPRPAIWPDGYYTTSSTSDNLIQRQAYVVDRVKMLKGQDAKEQSFILNNVNFLLNADIDGKQLPPKGEPNIMITNGGVQLNKVFEDDGLYVWKFHVDWKDSTQTKLEGPVKITVAPYHYLGDGQLTKAVPQPGTDQRLDAQGDKLMSRLVYRRIGKQESLVALHSVNTAAGGGGIRWYELRVDQRRNVSLYQQGSYAPDNNFRWMPGVAMDGNGNIGIGYSFGGAGHFPGQRFAGRLAGDSLGLLTINEGTLVEGEEIQTNTLRWEDYTYSVIDPSDDKTFWYVGDYLKKGAKTYSTKIGAFRLPDPPSKKK